MTRDVRLGTEVETHVETGDTHTYRLDLVAGTTFRVRARKADAAVILTVRAPDGTVLGTKTGDDLTVNATAAETGVYRAEVTSAGSATEYKVDFEGQSPPTGGGGTPTGAGTVHLDVPRGAFVRIEVRRISGAAPEVTGLRDGSSRDISFRVSKSERSKLRLATIPVSAPGGLDVDVRGKDGEAGTYDVRFRLVSDSDDGIDGHSESNDARRLVLTLAPGADPAQVAAALGYELKEVHDGFIVVETPEGREGHEYEDSADADDSSDDVTSAEPDAFVSAPEGTQSNPLILGSDYGRADVVNQPAMTSIRAAAAQQRSTGAGVVVAVLDTGVDPTHPDLAGHVLFDLGKDLVDNDFLAYDEAGPGGIAAPGKGYGHGTFVAGLILAVAPDAQILPVRVLDPNAMGTVSGIAAGIEWAVQQQVDVINLSLGMDAQSGVLGDAVRLAIANGIVVVAATGNGAQPAAVSFPASANGVLAVTATDPATGGPATFANGGPAATIAAPGANIIGPVPANTAGVQYGTWSGTSFSAAFASGAAALVVQKQPTWLPVQIVARVRTAARPAPSSLPRAQRRRLGGGKLDLVRLVR